MELRKVIGLEREERSREEEPLQREAVSLSSYLSRSLPTTDKPQGYSRTSSASSKNGSLEFLTPPRAIAPYRYPQTKK